MSLERKWDKIRRRDWDNVRDAWIAHIPIFPSLGAAPDPGLEQLAPLLAADIPEIGDLPDRVADVDGMRRNVLWEAVFLFHKCSHANLAAQRLALRGMHSWCMFNAYHAAYLGAKGTLALLGVALPNLGGKQVAIDLFPEEAKTSRRGPYRIAAPEFHEFLVMRLPLLEQRYLWEAFQRVLRISKVSCWDVSIQKELTSVGFEEITPPRNRFLYKAHFWPLGDLMEDASESMNALIGVDLDVDEQGFLLRLCFCVYRLFEQLIRDLGSYSAVIKAQCDGSRFLTDSDVPEVGCYKAFLSQISSQADVPRSDQR